VTLTLCACAECIGS